jgi:signal transduction histidine kinase
MGRLFWKIFVWFWLAMLLMGVGMTVTVVQHVRQSNDLPPGPFGRILESELNAVVFAVEAGGIDVARNIAATLSDGRRMRLDILEAATPPGEPSDGRRRDGIEKHAVAPDGTAYRIHATMHQRDRRRPPPVGRLLFGGPRDGALPWLKLAVGLTISSLVCLALAWYLSRPTRHLRHATRQLAAGDLSTRIGKAMGRRRDEIADLGRDFDTMAERLQGLMSAQQQLLSDVSHELRSPLARLRVAVALARQRQGDDLTDALDRVDREAERLGELVGEVLTLTRLQTGRDTTRSDRVDLVALLTTVTDGAAFEATAQDKTVHLELPERQSADGGARGCTVSGDGELLRRALENVVRNAVRHTANGSEVVVSLFCPAEAGIRIDVCDQGPGVPADFLPRLFEPFARATSARERGSGGYGLGLAIARRAILHHGGSIRAWNREQGGLCVEMELPHGTI